MSVGFYFTIQFYYTDYNSLVDAIVNSLHRPDIRNTITKRFFTMSKFATLHRFTWPCIVFEIAIIAAIIKWRKISRAFLQRLFQFILVRISSVAHSIISLPFLYKIVLGSIFIFVCCRGAYMAYAFYIQYDEAFNYNYFLHKNIFYSVVAYNNYPLHNIVSWLMLHSLHNSLFIQRLPSLLSGLCAALLLWYCVHRWFNSRLLSVLSLAIFISLPVFIYYSMYARGVMFNLLFTIIICFYLVEYGHTFNRRALAITSVLNAIALYSMVSHLYFIIVSSGYLFTVVIIEKKYRALYNVLFYVLLSVGLSCILLLPMYAGTGLSLGMDATNSSHTLSSVVIFKYVTAASDFISGNKLIHWLFILVNLVLCYLQRNLIKRVAMLNVCLLSTPILVALFTHVTPPERALSFITPAYIFTAVIALRYLLERSRTYMVIGLVTIVGGVLQYSAFTHSYLNWSKPLDKSAYEVSQLFLSKKIASCYCASQEFMYYTPALQYYFLHANQAFDFYSNNINSTRYQPDFKEISCIVVDKNDIKTKEQLESRSLIYTFNEFEIYALP